MLLAEQIAHIKHQNREYALGGIGQLNQMIRDNGQLASSKSEKLTQVAPETKQFISEFLENETLPASARNEVLCVIKTLLTIPAPAKQVEYLQRVKPLLEQSATNEALEKRQKEAENIKIHEAIMGLGNAGQDSDYCMTPLMDFLSKTERQKHIGSYVKNYLDICLERGHTTAAATFLAVPENQTGRQEEIAQLLALIREDKKKADSSNESSWWTYSPLVFFAEEKNRSLDETLFIAAAENINKSIEKNQLDDKLTEYICGFLVRGNNLNQFPHWFDAIIQTESAPWIVSNKFFNHPEVWAGREHIAVELRKKAIGTTQWGAIIEQCTDPRVPIPGSMPGEESYVPNIMDFIVHDEIQGKHLTVSDAKILRYMAHPEHHVDIYDQDVVNQKIAERLKKGSEFDYMAIVDFFNETKVENFSSATTDVADKVANRISDRILRAKALGLLRLYLADKTLPITLLESVPVNLVVVVVAFKLLGIDESVVRSWQLSEENINSLLPSLTHLAEVPSNRNAFADIILPFVPRSRENGRKVLIEKLTHWLNKIAFLSKVPKPLKGTEIVSEHLKNIQTLQQEYGISGTTSEISLSILRKIQTEINQMDTQLIEKLTQLIKLKEGITYDQVEQFIQDWNGDISCIIVLAAHYSSIYDEGLSYLGQKVTEIIEGTAELSRYNLADPLTRRQLQPLLLNSETDKQEKAISAWKNPGYSLILESSQTKATAISSYELTQKVTAELRQRATTQGHFHAEKIRELMSEHIGEEQAHKITQLITDCLQLNTEQPKNLIGQIVQELKKTQLNKDHQALLIGLAQLLRELSLGRETASNLANTTQKLVAKIATDWPELAAIDLINQDLKIYVTNELTTVNQESSSIGQAELFVCYTTDNPKTLLEIGRYPNSGSCQNFESTGNYNTGLPGYVFDSHIQAACISGVILPEALKNDPKALIGATISEVNLNLGTAQLHLKDAKTLTVKLSQPIARKMILLGSSTNSEFKKVPTLIAEPTYADSGLSATFIEEILDTIITTKRQNLSEQLKTKVLGNNDVKTGGYVTTIAGSHNPSGHYNDLATGLSGANGQNYEISFKRRKP